MAFSQGVVEVERETDRFCVCFCQNQLIKVTLKSSQHLPSILIFEGLPGSSVVRVHPPMQKTQETWVEPLSWEDALEKGKATLSRILAWEIPRAEEPGGL